VIQVDVGEKDRAYVPKRYAARLQMVLQRCQACRRPGIDECNAVTTRQQSRRDDAGLAEKLQVEVIEARAER
jgi:hypothetical protein